MKTTEMTRPAQAEISGKGNPASMPARELGCSSVAFAPPWKISISTRLDAKANRTFWGASGNNGIQHASAVGWSDSSDPSMSIAVGFYEIAESLPASTALTITGNNAQMVFDVIRERTEWTEELKQCTRGGNAPDPKRLVRAIRKAQNRLTDIRLAKNADDHGLKLLRLEAEDLSKRAKRMWPPASKKEG